MLTNQIMADGFLNRKKISQKAKTSMISLPQNKRKESEISHQISLYKTYHKFNLINPKSYRIKAWIYKVIRVNMLMSRSCHRGVLFSLIIKLPIRVSGEAKKGLDSVHKCGQMVLSMKGNGKTTLLTEKVHSGTPTVTNMKVK